MQWWHSVIISVGQTAVLAVLIYFLVRRSTSDAKTVLNAAKEHQEKHVLDLERFRLQAEHQTGIALTMMKQLSEKTVQEIINDNLSNSQLYPREQPTDTPAAQPAPDDEHDGTT